MLQKDIYKIERCKTDHVVTHVRPLQETSTHKTYLNAAIIRSNPLSKGNIIFLVSNIQTGHVNRLHVLKFDF